MNLKIHRLIIQQAAYRTSDVNDWQINFFVSKRTTSFYKKDLGIIGLHILNFTLDEDGFIAMETEGLKL